MTGDQVGEEVITFCCETHRLWGVLSRPTETTAQRRTAVLIVVGGPQYRVGSHRQFVLLARGLARAGYPVLRFDYRGMGDSEGDLGSFKRAGPDIGSAIDAFAAASPHADRFVVWGLCDAASAALMFATRDPRVTGIVAANPWIRSEATLAATRVRHYYASRLGDREFWAKLLRRDLRLGPAVRSLARACRDALAGSPGGARDATGRASFQTTMAEGLAAFRGRLLLVLSGNDLTAKEFLHVAATDRFWRRLLDAPNVSRHDIREADHTFSRSKWLAEVQAQTIRWLNEVANARHPKTDQNAMSRGA